MKIILFLAGPSGVRVHCPEATRLGKTKYLGYDVTPQGYVASEEPSRFALLPGAAGLEEANFLRKQIEQGHLLPYDSDCALALGVPFHG